MSELLEKARRYEAEAEKRIPLEERPVYHLSPRTGWTNDPNGLVFYQGKAHLFYQYYPYEPRWNSMHWGHAVSKDLVSWEYLPAAMAPDEAYDSFGCFSGSSIELPDGRQLLMYTGVRPEESPSEEGKKIFLQTQCLAVGDGEDYVKYEGNPVLTSRDIPEGFSPTDFRDPRIFRFRDGRYGCVVGNRSDDGSGALLLFEGEDAFHWHFYSVLDRCRHEYGTMWECPDFFQLDGQDVILTSPMQMKETGLEFIEGGGTLCLIGTFDETSGTFRRSAAQSIDYGLDFYAPQTFEMPDGRRIMIGWMQNWASCFIPEERSWFGQMTVPRELSIREGRLIQNPVREIESLRGEKTAYENIMVEGTVSLPDIQGRVMDLAVHVRPDGEGSFEGFSVKFAQDEAHECALAYDPKASVLTIDRTKAGFIKAAMQKRSCFVKAREGRIDLRILLDRYSAEIFVNGGEQAISLTYYLPQETDGISFEAEGRALLDVEAYPLERKGTKDE